MSYIKQETMSTFSETREHYYNNNILFACTLDLSYTTSIYSGSNHDSIVLDFAIIKVVYNKL